MLSLRLLLPAALALAAFFVYWCEFAAPAVAADPDLTDQARKFLTAHESKLRPLEIKANLAWWDANTTGKDEDFKRKEEAQNHIDAALADAAAFKEVKELHEKR